MTCLKFDKANSPIHFTQMDRTLSSSAGLHALCVPQRHLWWTKGAGDGKGSASVWDEILQVVNAELKCLKWSIYNFFLLFIVLYWYSFHLFPISLWFVHPSPNVLRVLVIFHTKIWFSMNSTFKVFNQWEKWDYRPSETLLLKLRHFS